jgi:hypothetical protein
VDHVFPCVPVRQWVLSLPKRLRYFVQRDADLAGQVLRVFLRAVEPVLRKASFGAPPEARFGGVTFVQRPSRASGQGSEHPSTVISTTTVA